MASYFDGTNWSQPEVVSAWGDTLCNYLDVKISDNLGALVYTVFVDDIVNGYHEKVKLIPWSDDQFDPLGPVELYVDSTSHVQLPVIALAENGRAAVAIKTERLMKKEAGDKISQVDLFTGNLNYPYSPWVHIVANPYVCDTGKQVAELNLAFSGNDTLLMLSQEYPLLATNAPFNPQNGILFGHPYMNLVLRGFKINEEGVVEDLDENVFSLGIEELEYNSENASRLWCYPNPCDDHSTVQFSILQDSEVKIDLFSVDGSLHINLIKQVVREGTYELDVNTALLLPGAYIIRLQTNDFIQTAKIIVSK
jgi:hypothetical protein